MHMINTYWVFIWIPCSCILLFADWQATSSWYRLPPCVSFVSFLCVILSVILFVFLACLSTFHYEFLSVIACLSLLFCLPFIVFLSISAALMYILMSVCRSVCLYVTNIADNINLSTHFYLLVLSIIQLALPTLYCSIILPESSCSHLSAFPV